MARPRVKPSAADCGHDHCPPRPFTVWGGDGIVLYDSHEREIFVRHQVGFGVPVKPPKKGGKSYPMHESKKSSKKGCK